MKIVYVTDALAILGGIERVLVDKVNMLTEQLRYDIFVITVNQGDHPIPFPLYPRVVHQDLGLHFHQQYRFHGLRRMMKIMELNRLFKKQLHEQFLQIQPDVIVCIRIELLRAILSVKGGIPLVFESHGMRHAGRFAHANWFERLKAAYYNRVVRHIQQIVALTEGDARDWHKANSRVSIIPNVVHLNPLGRCCIHQAKSVIFVGRFHTQKDIPSLLTIWQMVYQRHPNWQLQMYGDYGDEQAALLSKISHVNTNIVVHEPTSDIFNCYLESSVLVLTSLYEPFGLVLPEAMSCGLPVVAFDCPYGPADIITDGQDGFLIRHRDMNDFAEKVCLLIENEALRQRMGQAAVISSQRYQPSLIMPQWKKLFESLSGKE